MHLRDALTHIHKKEGRFPPSLIKTNLDHNLHNMKIPVPISYHLKMYVFLHGILREEVYMD